MKADKFIGKFNLIGKQYAMLTPGSAEITQTNADTFLEVSIFDQTPNGTILTIKTYGKNGQFISLKIGQIVKVRNHKGKVISKYIQYVDESDNGVSSWYVSKLNKKGYVTQYAHYRVESGFNINTAGELTLGVANTNQNPQIGQRTATRVKKFPWEQ